MGVINRTLDTSEQRKVYEGSFGALVTGVTAIVSQVPYPCILEKAQLSAFGVSGAPAYQLVVNRFIAGAGATAIPLGPASAPPPFSGAGASGVLLAGMSLPASGSTLLQLLANDVVMVLTSGAASAVTGLCVSLVIRPIQDVKINFGLI